MISPASFLTALGFASIASLASASATLQGSFKITPQDYYGLPPSGLANNPPACGMPYNQLNLARITAVQNMNTGSTCNLCLKVTNTANPSKFVYVLAVDLGGNGLDLSIPAFEYIFGQRYDASPASWSTVDYSFCDGVYTPGKINPNQGVTAGSSHKPTATTKKPKKTTTKKSVSKKTTTTKKSKTTIKKSVTKKKTTTKKKSTTKKQTHNKKKTTTKKSSPKKKTLKKKSSSKKKTTTKKSKTHSKKRTTKKPTGCN